MQNVSTRAVVLGGGAGLLFTASTYFVLAFLDEAAAPSAWVLAVVPFVGLVGHVVGGHVAARVAGRAEVLNGALSSLPGIVLTALTVLFGEGAPLTREHVARFMAGALLAASGGYLRRRRTRRRAVAVETPAIPPGSRISIKGVALGGLANLLASAAATSAVGVHLIATGTPQDQVEAALFATPSLLAVGIVFGALADVLGGYVAARVARRAEVLNGSLSSVPGIGLTGAWWMTGTAFLPLWAEAALIVLSGLCGALAGYLRARQIGPRDAPIEPGRLAV